MSEGPLNTDHIASASTEGANGPYFVNLPKVAYLKFFFRQFWFATLMYTATLKNFILSSKSELIKYIVNLYRQQQIFICCCFLKYVIIKR